MDFIIENYIWFLFGGIILLMTLIGYIADKSNYIEKQKQRDEKSKMQNEVKKKEHLTYGKKAFNKEIGKGENLVLEESLLTYPVEFDREVEEIIIANNQEEVVQDIQVDEVPVEAIPEIETPSSEETVESNNKNVAIEPTIINEEEQILTPVEMNNETNEDDIWNF